MRPAWIETSGPKACSLETDTDCGRLQPPPEVRIAACTTLSWPVVETCQTATALPSRSIATRGDSAATAGSEIVSDSPNTPYRGRKAARIDSPLSSTSRQTASTSPEPFETSCGCEPERWSGEIVSAFSSLAPLCGKPRIVSAPRSAASSRGRMRFIAPSLDPSFCSRGVSVQAAPRSMDARWVRDGISRPPADSCPESDAAGSRAAHTGLMQLDALGLDVLVQPEHVVRVPFALERNESLVLRVAVDRP